MSPPNPITRYFADIGKIHARGGATEASYRSRLQTFLESVLAGRDVVHEHEQLFAIGRPDFLVLDKPHERLLGCIETKPIGDKDLRGEGGNEEQFARYKNGLPVCVFTDYLSFAFYQGTELVEEVAIGKVTGRGISELPQNHARLIYLLQTVFGGDGQPIASTDKLVRRMAGGTALLRDTISLILRHPDSPSGKYFANQMGAFRRVLLHTMDEKEFADIYAQTIAYGMLAARLHCPADVQFTRLAAGGLIPLSNPFIRKFFIDITGHNIDPCIRWIVDGMADLFAVCDVKKIMHEEGRRARADNPIIHFYETFLTAYDPAVRMMRGVWYTPEPVVDFIVRAVDDALVGEFGMRGGLADYGKTRLGEREVHKLQILDPAAGTGTFLAQVVKRVRQKMRAQQGAWSDYVEQHLLPRLNGFEFLAASYAMAHLQLDILLQETGYAPRSPNTPPRRRVYLTNSLEMKSGRERELLANWLSEEANEAAEIKRDAPVMCVLGNPPYRFKSANKKNAWMEQLLADYKKEPNSEAKIKHLNAIADDYVKFIRYGQHFIEKNGSGVLAFINPHSYLSNRTFRGMRWSLLSAFDKIYVIDLHGNTRKKERAPDDEKDENVFAIQHGVCINLFVKTGKKPRGELARVFYCDMYGRRDDKYRRLQTGALADLPFEEIAPQAPMFFMTPVDLGERAAYESGFALNDLFVVKSLAITTNRDKFCIQFSRDELNWHARELLALPAEEAREKFSLGADAKHWRLGRMRDDLKKHYPARGGQDSVCQIGFQPFDHRWTVYTGVDQGFHRLPRADTMPHFLAGDNVGLVFTTGLTEDQSVCAMVTAKISRHRYWTRSGMTECDHCAPLYLYDSPDKLRTGRGGKNANLDSAIAADIAKAAGLAYAAERDGGGEGDEMSPLDVLDYVYAMLHSPAYRKKYGEFLKTEFPRIPYPSGADEFRRLAALGARLRVLHLLQAPELEDSAAQCPYPAEGDNRVTKCKWQPAANGSGNVGRVFINDSQYFDNVPVLAWQFYLGGYQPAQKWLQARRGRPLEFDDILHYQKIIACLAQTRGVVEEIDAV